MLWTVLDLTYFSAYKPCAYLSSYGFFAKEVNERADIVRWNEVFN